MRPMNPKSAMEFMNSNKNKLNNKVNWSFNLEANTHLESIKQLHQEIQEQTLCLNCFFSSGHLPHHIIYDTNTYVNRSCLY